MRQRRVRFAALALAAALMAGLFPRVGITLGADASTIHEIGNLDDLMNALAISKTTNGQTHTYKLKNDLDLDNTAWVTLKARDIDQVTFGDADHPFQGTFDGQGHTISGLRFENENSLRTCTGLIYSTQGNGGQHAVIRDLTVQNASLYAAACGGIVVGSAENTDILNVTVRDSFLHAYPGDQVLTLVTDGGVAGGAIAGQVKNSILYNCAVENTNVVCNRTSAVAALGGKGLYLGALVGIASGSTIEYCRAMGGKVSNRYDNAVGAVGGYTVYAGGVTGWAGDGSKLTDCFSTTTLYTYCATYVSVGSGNAGYCGGITASTNGSDSEGYLTMTRCHYAGQMSSRQYNAVLVIPVIQDDQNLRGLVGINRGGAGTLVQKSWYTAHDAWSGVGGTAAVEGAYGPRSEKDYADRLVWLDDGYDFAGTVDRKDESAYQTDHANKWVMYTEYERDGDTGALVLDESGSPIPTGRRYPVHGNSVTATFSFPGAGSVTISPTAANALAVAGETTDNAYAPAVLPLRPAETGVSLSADLKDGYRLNHWHKWQRVTGTLLPYDPRYFQRYINETDSLGAGQEPFVTTCEDSDLYVAHVQARVIFHDLAGNEVGLAGAVNPGVELWYDFADPLPEIVPENQGDPPSGFFVGWTEKAPPAGGWDNVADISEDSVGKLYQTGDPIEKTMSLYPVYANLLSGQVYVRVEGHTDGDICVSNSLTCARENVAQATVGKDAKGQPQLELRDAAGTALLTDAAMPEGYRFSGWYEYDDQAAFDSGDTAKSHKVGQDYAYSLAGKEGKRYYEARFEYRVTLYAPHNRENTSVGLEKYQEVYVPNNTQLFTSVADDAARSGSRVWVSPYFQPFDFNWDSSVASNEWDFICWADMSKISGVEFKKSDYVGLQTDPGAYDWENEKVTEPLELAALLDCYTLAALADYNAIAQTDFPNSGSILLKSGDGHSRDPQLTVFSGYHFVFFDVVKYKTDGTVHNGHNNTSKGSLSGTGMAEDPIQWDNGVDTNTASRHTDVYTAYMTADVTFHTGESDTTITRRYRSPVFGTALNNSYATYDQEAPATLTFDTAETGTAPADESMYLDDYYFAGWFEPDKLTAADKAYLGISDAAPASGPRYQTDRVEKAAAFVLPGDAVVERTMELYPLYVPYDVTVNCNFDEITVIKDLDEQGMTVEVKGPLRQTAGGVERAFDILALAVGDGKESALADTRADDNWAISDPYPVTPGVKYVFTAYYKPFDARVRFFPKKEESANAAYVHPAMQVDSKIGDIVPATGEVDHHVDNPALDGALFTGWTQTVPESGLYHLDPPETMLYKTPGELRHTLVTGNLDYYPVYQSWTVTARTADGGEIAGVRGDDPTTVAFTAPAPAEGQVFDGWYDSAGEKVSDEGAYTPDDPFSGETFTARYKEKPVTYTIRFHGLDGAVIETATVVSDQSYTFPISETEEQTFPAAALTFRRDFTTAEGTVYRVDNFPQAQLDIQDALAANETFEEWVWLQADGTAVNYTAFVANSTPILTILGGAGVTEMDLYPVYYTMTAFKDGADVTHTNDRASTQGEIAPAAQVARSGDQVAFSGVTALLHPADNYSAATVVVNVKKSTWAGTAPAKTTAPVPDAPVTLYWSDDTTTPVMASVSTDATGDAAFTFPLALGDVTLTLQAPAARAGETFLVDLSGTYKVSGDVERPYTLTIPLTCDKNGGAQVDIKPPLNGTYTVTARPVAGLSFQAAPASVTPAAGRTETVTITAAAAWSPASGNWLRGTDRRTNLFGRKEGV